MFGVAKIKIIKISVSERAKIKEFTMRLKKKHKKQSKIYSISKGDRDIARKHLQLLIENFLMMKSKINV